MSDLPPKALSVTVTGEPDNWVAPRSFRAQVAPDGQTRLVIYVPQDELPALHLRLIAAMGDEVGVAYVQLTDRKVGKPHPAPVRYLGLGQPTARVVAALQERAALIWHDGRHQLWVRGVYGDQVVLDELGVLYCYPDDPSFREVLAGLPERSTLGMDSRDYVKVSFVAEADAQEQSLFEALNMVRWSG